MPRPTNLSTLDSVTWILVVQIHTPTEGERDGKESVGAVETSTKDGCELWCRYDLTFVHDPAWLIGNLRTYFLALHVLL